MTPSRYHRIENSAALAAAVDHALGMTAVAMDLEADSMFHFQERVCLIQMATSKHIFIIDPLSIDDLAPLGTLLASAAVEKIFHGADYDVRSLYRDYEFELDRLFDTELASRFLGVKQTGLNNILEDRFSVKLDKRFQKKDWSQRPLPEAMVAYAANDVAYLLPLAQTLRDELTAAERLAWVAEELEHLRRVRPAEENGDPLFMRFKGAGRLQPRQLSILEALLQVRRQIARHKDRPPFKVMSNRAITRLVEATPTDARQVRQSGALSPKQLQMYADQLSGAVKNALALPAGRLPRYPRQPRGLRKPSHPERIKRFKVWREHKARALDLEPGLILNNALLTAIADQNPRSLAALARVDGIRNWQVQSFGPEILTLIPDKEKKRARS